MEHILVDTKDGVRTLKLNRPERLNAVNSQLSLEIVQAFKEASLDDEVRAVIVTGNGRGFCAGLDLEDLGNQKASEKTRHETLDDLGWVGHQALGIVQCDKPVIAAINGVAAGAGFALSLACDIRFISESAKVTTGYIRRGLSPDAGMSYFLPRLIGYPKAAELIFTGRDIGAQEAKELGLVNDVLPDEDLYNHALDLAKEIAAGPPVAMTYSKRLLTASNDIDLTTLLKQEYLLIQKCFQTNDVQEGVQAFLEKRNPVFQGE